MGHSVKKTYPFGVYYGGVVVLVLAGLFVSFYLLQSHYRNFADIDYRSFCAISKAINCDTVSQSPYAIFWDLPVSLWGVVGYLLLLFGVGMARNKEPEAILWHLIFLLGVVYSCISVILAIVTIFFIHAWCIMCVLTYGVNFSVAFLAYIILNRFSKVRPVAGLRRDLEYLWAYRRRIFPGFALIAFLFITVWLFFPRYWEIKPSEDFAGLNSGETEEGYPWIGAENPEFTIVEFSDYMCFQCRKMHFFLRQIVRQHPDRIRLVHRHFPMDMKYNPLVTDNYHSGAGKMAILALYAQVKDQFWKVNDLLFEIAGLKTDFNTRTIADAIGVPPGEVSAALNSRELRLLLKHDIAVGIRYGLEGTPGFVIDGEVYSGTIPKEILEKILLPNE